MIVALKSRFHENCGLTREPKNHPGTHQTTARQRRNEHNNDNNKKEVQIQPLIIQYWQICRGFPLIKFRQNFFVLLSSSLLSASFGQKFVAGDGRRRGGISITDPFSSYGIPCLVPSVCLRCTKRWNIFDERSVKRPNTQILAHETSG